MFSKWLKLMDKDTVEELHTWLIQNVVIIQKELGSSGIAANFIPPGLSQGFTNYQVIINTLPYIKIGVASELEVNSCKDALNKHIGVLKYSKRVYLKRLINPIQWIIEGIKAIVTFPENFMEWVGLKKYRKKVNIEGSNRFKFISSVIAIIGFIGTIVGIIADWQDFLTIITDWITKLK